MVKTCFFFVPFSKVLDMGLFFVSTVQTPATWNVLLNVGTNWKEAEVSGHWRGSAVGFPQTWAVFLPRIPGRHPNWTAYKQMSNVVRVEQRRVIATQPISPCASVEVKRINVTGQWESAACDCSSWSPFVAKVQSSIVSKNVWAARVYLPQYGRSYSRGEQVEGECKEVANACLNWSSLHHTSQCSRSVWRELLQRCI